jgi:Family of unknown function (DUF6527)
MKQSTITPQYVGNIPEKLDEGMLYICERYHIAAHKCCCGCGQEVITPLTPADWLIKNDNNLITLFPSIGNWSFACQSHYWIKQNKVVWSSRMSEKEIERVRAKDKSDKLAYIASVNLEKVSLPIENKKQITKAESIFAKILQLIKELLKVG